MSRDPLFKKGEVYTVKEVAKVLKVSERTIRDRLNRSSIPVLKPGVRSYRYRGEDLTHYGLG